jgi:hypothetical protein
VPNAHKTRRLRNRKTPTLQLPSTGIETTDGLHLPLNLSLEVDCGRRKISRESTRAKQALATKNSTMQNTYSESFHLVATRPGFAHADLRRVLAAGIAAASLALAACGGGGSSSSNAPPTVSLSASPASISAGASATLSWSSTNATACTASGGWSGSKDINGSSSTGTLSATTSYTLTCTGAGGSAKASATVTVTPHAVAVTLTANPSAIASGGTTMLSWTSSGATSCTASGGWSGTKATSGNISTGALTVTTAYMLSCTGAGVSKATSATVTVVSGSVNVAPKLATLTLSQKQQFTASVPGNASAKWSVDGVTGGNSDVGTISATGLYTPGSVVGTHTIVATSALVSSQSGAATAAVTGLSGIYTRHTDAARTGLNAQEYALTPTLVGTSGAFGKIWGCALDGAMYAQPLYVANLSINGAVHNVIFLATENDSVYAIDADASNCTQYWKASFIGTINGSTVVPVPASIPYQSPELSQWDILYEIGITGTPVISAAQNTIYVVAKTQETDPSNTVTYHDRLHALNLATGDEQTNSPVDITASIVNNSGTTVAFTSLTQNQRPALLLADYSGGSGSAVYISYASYGDLGTYNGWIIAYDAASLTQTAAWNDTPNGIKGGIWISDGGIAVDSGGALYLSTGNGTFDDTTNVIPPVAPSNDFGETFVKLDPTTLAVTDFYAPSQTALWASEDEDLSASGVTVLPDGIGPGATPNMLVGSDKQGHLWLINRNLMSRFNAGADNTIQYLTMPNIAACSLNCTFGTPAYYNGTVYFGMVANPLMAFTLTGGIFSQSGGIATPSSQSVEDYNFPGTTPVISASPAGDGIVWVLDSYNNGTATNGPQTVLGPSILRAYAATNLGTTIYSSSNLASDAAANAVKFQEPVVANGHVYVAGASELSVYGPK